MTIAPVQTKQPTFTSFSLTQTSSGSTIDEPTEIPPSPVSNSDTPLNPNIGNINIQEGNLLIQSHYGIQCPNRGLLQDDQLVLASDRTTYSQNEIAQMRACLGSTSEGVNPLDNPTPPSTLRWVLGGSMDIIPVHAQNECGASLRLINTGNTPIQTPQVGVQLEERPQEKAYQYHLIDVCSLVQCVPLIGGNGDCHTYFASIQLGLGEQNTVFSAVPHETDPTTGGSCGILTIAPAAQVDLSLNFPLDPTIPKNLIYSVVPTFTVDTDQGEQVLSLSQFASTLAYASGSQFPCYGLQGNRFVLESSLGNCV